LKFTPFQIAVHVAAWLPLGWLAFDFFNGRMAINPIQELSQRTGRYALYLLVLSLTCTPLNTLFGWRQALKVRRPLGLYAFMYAALHFLIFVGLDYGFNWAFLKPVVLEKPFIIAGAAAGTILLALAVTSFRGWQKRLGKHWKRLHRLVYLAAGLVIAHYAWAVKGDLLRLQGNILAPLVFGLVVAALLVMRLPAVARLRRRSV
jgi:sulfoxide reductase heme-binding subunit YedZ